MPHCGIVTDVTKLQSTGSFQVVEGNTSDGNPKNSGGSDGVYLRVRRLSDVMMFIRPKEFQGPSPVQLLLKMMKLVKAEKLELDELEAAVTNPMLVSIQYLEPGRRNKQVEVVQLALSMCVDIHGAARGQWDQATRAAFARYQRNIGRVGQDASGLPDIHTLRRLAQETGVFQV
jgi:hypothetical protein